ncbi:MAG: zinc ribbon domain-containing protein [Spirochaetia bacterium]|nr:zinc ribbon domain-containing protein [Spirochaetia bacterium]
MPTYDYKCEDCGHSFEVFQKMSDEPITSCPVCNGKVRRLIGGGVGVIFKGSGFYVTDNRSKNSDTKRNNSDSAAADKTQGQKNNSPQEQSGGSKKEKTSQNPASVKKTSQEASG